MSVAKLPVDVVNTFTVATTSQVPGVSWIDVPLLDNISNVVKSILSCYACNNVGYLVK